MHGTMSFKKTHSYTLLNPLAHYFNRLPTKYTPVTLLRIILHHVVLKLWRVNYTMTCIGMWG